MARIEFPPRPLESTDATASDVGRGGQTNNCLQIYFEFDHESERVLIGYCGRHLPYAGQRT